jgi:hypothetical protein
VLVSHEGLEVRSPDGESQSIHWPRVRRILVRTNDTGPSGADVWWVLEGQDRACSFPQGATGEADALREIVARFPKFEALGMNSTANATFVCWDGSNGP